MAFYFFFRKCTFFIVLPEAKSIEKRSWKANSAGFRGFSLRISCRVQWSISLCEIGDLMFASLSVNKNNASTRFVRKDRTYVRLLFFFTFYFFPISRYSTSRGEKQLHSIVPNSTVYVQNNCRFKKPSPENRVFGNNPKNWENIFKIHFFPVV